MLRTFLNTAAIAAMLGVPAAAMQPKAIARAAKLIQQIGPAYPVAAILGRVEGAVLLSAVIDHNGKLTNIQVMRGSALLAPAAVEAVKQWIYEPSKIDGRPVPVETRIKVNFAMQK